MLTPLVVFALAAAPVPNPAPVPLFDGTTLAGWHNVNCGPKTWAVKDGAIVTSGFPTGYMRSAKQYENFELEFDWMHVRKEGMANSGLFVWGDCLPAVGTGYTRSIEVQVLINYKPADGWATSHGDLFSIWGAKCVPDRPHPKGLERCLPSEDRVKGAGEWNHYKVVAKDGVLKLEVNGKEVSGVSKSSPRKGYLALESEGSECHFKNITLLELPSTNPKPAECATADAGHVSLLSGVDLSGWAETKDWKAGDGSVRPTGKTALTAAKAMPAGELVFDWKAKDLGEYTVTLGGAAQTVKAVKAGQWQRSVLTAEAGALAFPAAAGLELRNVFFAAKK